MAIPLNSMTRLTARSVAYSGAPRRLSTPERASASIDPKKVGRKAICSGARYGWVSPTSTAGRKSHKKANQRLLDALASVDDSRTVEELTAEIQKPIRC